MESRKREKDNQRAEHNTAINYPILTPETTTEIFSSTRTVLNNSPASGFGSIRVLSDFTSTTGKLEDKILVLKEGGKSRITPSAGVRCAPRDLARVLKKI